MSKEYNSCKGLTPLQALDELCDDLSICNDAECENQKDLEFSKLWVRQHKELIEKSLKALEIIKKKLVDMPRLADAIIRNDLSYYNYFCYELLTKKNMNY